MQVYELIRIYFKPARRLPIVQKTRHLFYNTVAKIYPVLTMPIILIRFPFELSRRTRRRRCMSISFIRLEMTQKLRTRIRTDFAQDLCRARVNNMLFTGDKVSCHRAKAVIRCCLQHRPSSSCLASSSSFCSNLCLLHARTRPPNAFGHRYHRLGYHWPCPQSH